ncbi:MAG: NAD(P)-binding domain-containing protein, partial [Clostridium sp.]|nr:NAD(P)-binding domain-containing protein [Clostridium sp.]
MNNKIAFIGAGNMGYAMISSVAKSNILPAENILVFDVDKEKLLRLKEELNICTAASAYDAVKNADIVILAVKPNMVKEVLTKIKTAMDDKKILVSV